MNEHITQPSGPCDPQSSIAMQAGLALLDLVAALAPTDQVERHKMGKHLEESLQKALPEHWYHQALLREMQEILG